jgi:hypothetical protein
LLKGVGQAVHIGLQVTQGNPFLVEIDLFGPSRQSAHQSQITTITTHDLYHETAASRHRRLFNFINRLHNVVEGGVGSDAQLRAGQIIVNRSG